MQPIRFDGRQIALMVEVGLCFVPDFCKRAGEPSSRLRTIAAGIAPPTPAVLRCFGLEEQKGGFVWNPR